MHYRPPFSAERTAVLRRWHERAYREMSEAGERRLSYLGLDLGRVLLFFGTSGDQDHVLGLAAGAGLAVETVRTRELTRDGLTVTYSTFRLTVRLGGRR
ncbi:hypothetical protein FHX44_117967 [Pseudonocardia hierapolitana]|uniref:Uncharacterized protein n=1 Tax=Pseudonocardia hierapolitana TaxID=1128676 RepID=A0A561T4J9_9PSEU|nr:hypothetical protein [Pseudonocardia hierapolitana]TWF82022.1 hypothetical protein FHX44_117967 [Pseudonocardia hierapolitana]